MLYGYVSIAYNQIKIAREQIKEIKQKYNYTDELKWTNVHDATYLMYKELIEYFFMTDMNFRAVIVNKADIDETRQDYTFNDFYFRMYYQLLHNKIDLENSYNIYFDIKDTCSGRKLSELKKMLAWNSSIRNFQFIKSYESLFMQFSDVLMGAINYNLRIKAGDVAGKVIAKRKLVEHISSHANISLEQSTSRFAKKFNLFFISLK
jgi:hypothetical protein